jgi:hypothetical protein
MQACISPLKQQPDYQFVEHLLPTYEDYLLAKPTQAKIILHSADKQILLFETASDCLLDASVFERLKQCKGC